MFQRTILALSLAFAFIIITGCSSQSNPTTPTGDVLSGQPLVGQPQVGVSERFPDGSPASGMGALGIFNLVVNADEISAEMTPIRQNSLTDVLEVVDITNFLMMAPCSDCAKIGSISIDADGNLVVSIGIKHPFEAGDSLKPVTGKNRGDLHVFNIEGTIVSDLTGRSFPGLGNTTAGFTLVNADGYTPYLDTVLDEIYPTDATVHPYILHFDDYTAGNFDAGNPMGFASVTDPPPSGNLVMAMGCDFDYQDYVFSIDGAFDFIYAVGCTYAVSSASKNERFTPEYRVPQHLKKAASEVSIEIITNDLKGEDTLSTAEIEIHVVDISHDVAVGTNLDEMFAASNVDDIMIDIPGVTSGLVVIDGNNEISGTGHDPLDPLVYETTITNEAGGVEGTYLGLVKVSDNYAPGLNANPLLSGMDGIKRVEPVENPLVGLFSIAEFATYQAFSIDVATGNEIPVAILIPTPDPANITQFNTVDFDATTSYDTDGTITLYEFDYDWDNDPLNFAADDSNATGLVTSPSFDTVGTFTVGLRVTDDLGAVGYDSVTVDVAEISAIFVDDSNTTGIEDGTADHPYNTIQEGLAAAVAGDEVWVDDSGNDYAGPIILAADVTLLSTNWDSSDGDDQADIFSTGLTPVVTGADGATIDGFKIHGGDRYGVRVSGVDTTIQNCFITDIVGTRIVYAIRVENSTGTLIEGCEMYDIRTTDNWPYDTHVIYLNNSPITVSGCEIHYVRVGGDWPHIFVLCAENCAPQSGAHLEIRRNKIYDVSTGRNWCDMYAIRVVNCDEAEICNNLVHSITAGSWNHSVSYNGCHGILVATSSDVELVNNTVYNVRRTGYYGNIYGVRIESCPNFDGRNNIVNRIRRNVSYQSAVGVRAAAGTVWEYCDVFDAANGIYSGGIAPGTGCITADPMFVAVSTDFHLQAGSPCIDSGDPLIDDVDGSRSDMGCYGGPGGDW